MKPSEFARKRFLELWEAYKAKGGTQSSLAAATGIGQGHISTWIRGGMNPNMDNLAALAKGFGVSIAVFLPPDGTEIGDLIAIACALDQDKFRSLLAHARLYARASTLDASEDLPNQKRNLK